MKKILLVSIIAIFFLAVNGCGDSDHPQSTTADQVEYSPEKDIDLQKYNIEAERKLAGSESVCDTLALAEYILDTYPSGSYLVTFDRTNTYDVPRYAVKYMNNGYILALVATSRPGERLIEVKNIVGYDQSFINLDSTKLGTAFFYLTLFDCSSGEPDILWEAPVPNHGGFNTMTVERWRDKRVPYVRINFHYARGIGHIDYNYFIIDGWEYQPHLMMTYKGINFKRTIGNVNDDRFPDYYEFAYYDFADRIAEVDSVPFIWSVKDSVYVNTRNKRQTRLY